MRYQALLGIDPLLGPTRLLPSVLPPVVVLDVGCGLGHLAHVLQRDGRRHIHLLGMDVVPGFVAHAQTHYPDHEFLAYNLADPADDTTARQVLSDAVHRLEGRRVLHNSIRHDTSAVLRFPADTELPVDWIVASGIFALGNITLFEQMTRRFSQLVRRGFAFNIHSQRWFGIDREVLMLLLFCCALPFSSI